MKKTMLTGGRPTGKLHLGHYTGAFKKFVEMQSDYQDVYCIMSDIHMLTTSPERKSIELIWENTINMVIDVVGMGADVNKVHFYLQSNVPEMTYIYTLIQNYVNVMDINETPSLIKTLNEMQYSSGKTDFSLGLLAYPVMEAADIIALQADEVPVGKDNIDHVNITRKIVERINIESSYLFKKPEWVTTDNNYIVGTDGKNKMSKSLDNCIYIRDTNDEIFHKINNMIWQKDNNVVLEYIKIFAEEEYYQLQKNFFEDLNEKKCKDLLCSILIELLEPMRNRSATLANARSDVENMIKEGTKLVREKSSETLERLKVGLGYDINNCILKI